MTKLQAQATQAARERRLFDVLAEWPKSERPALVELLRRLADELDLPPQVA